MLATLILGVAAGLAVPFAEPKMKDLIEGLLQDVTPLDGSELRLFTFAALLLAAAVLSLIFGTPHAMPLALGAAIGVFAPRLIEMWRTSSHPDYDS